MDTKMSYVWRSLLIMVIFVALVLGINGCGTINGMARDVEDFSSGVRRHSQNGVNKQQKKRYSLTNDEQELAVVNAAELISNKFGKGESK